MNDTSKQFLDEMKALFRKYGASLEMEEDIRRWDGSTYKMTVFACTKYDEDGNMIRDEVDLDLGHYFNGE